MKRLVIAGLHVCYWGMFTLMAALFQIAAARTAHLPLASWLRALVFPGSFMFGPAILAFYIFYFFCFRLLRRKRFWQLGMVSAAVSYGAALFVLTMLRLFRGPSIQLTLTWDTFAEVTAAAFIAFVNGVMALVIHGFVDWYSDIRLKESLRRKNMEMELALLKSQLNPHFLFNTLNNIDVLIARDADRASDYLNKLSDLLRFMLYEAGEERISMRQELKYIGQYIELQRIRTAHPESIRYSVEGEPGEWMVAPMLFLPFIENAFKHADKKAGEAIRIRFELGRERIFFDCENRYNRAVPDTAGGLGNSLMRKRLNLLYPGKHDLRISAGEDSYRATLILESHAN